MSFSQKREGDLVKAYDRSLEQQIVELGSSLPCRDEELQKQVEGLLRDGNAQEIHCLGLDPLTVMEESLKAVAAPAAGCRRQVRTRGGLQGLAKAFEVLEQAALNLYLGPWREEYKVIQMYSGMFTHYITPVLSMLQIENLFGLLGYQPSVSSPEQLPRVGRTSPADLLRLSCAFFLARCECHLLAAALGKHSGDTQWELGVVMERQQGNSLQVAVDNTKKMLENSEPQMEHFDGEVDLYCDEQGERQVVVNNDESPRSIIWGTQSSTSPPAVKTHSNGLTSLSPPLESLTSRNSSDSKRPGWRSHGEKRLDETNSDPRSLQVDPIEVHKSRHGDISFCHCVRYPDLCHFHCTDCNTLHILTCDYLDVCTGTGHNVEQVEQEAVSLHSGGLTSPTVTRSSAPVCSLPLHDDPGSIIPPPRAIAYHHCCDLNNLDPEILCRSCRVFHSKSCREVEFCLSKHDSTCLRRCCLCEKWCPRKPLVLCRYCGNEYCNSCWYRNPVICSCGQTFDQSTSV